MNDEIKQEQDAIAAVAASSSGAPAKESAPRGRAPLQRGRRPARGGSGNDRRPSRGGKREREPRERAEFDQRTLVIRRVARVIAGGRRFSFSAAIVAGDRRGRVGIGLGKGGDTALAIEKALRDAKKNMIMVKLSKDMSISHDVYAKSSSAIVAIRPAPQRGIVAGSAVKLVLELAGIKDVTAKILSPSKNKLNIARATVKALQTLKK
jgi:small subunit ribosomal protein S5